MQIIQHQFLVVAYLLLLMFASTPVYAHKVNMFAYVDGNKVSMEGYFSDGKKPVNCEVVVTNPEKKILVKGMTDNEGKFSFNIPEITDLHIALSAGMGHRAEFVITRDELAGVSTAAAAQSAPSTVSESTESDVGKPEKSQNDTTPAGGISEAALRRVIAEANVPLLRAIDELKERADFSNIVGGIGFIFGVVGVFFYVKARKILGVAGTRSTAGN